MYQNRFGDPYPKGTDELIQVFDEHSVDPSDASVTIDLNEDDDPPFNGYSAEITFDGEDGETINISTLGYEHQSTLLDDLRAAGIHNITL